MDVDTRVPDSLRIVLQATIVSSYAAVRRGRTARSCREFANSPHECNYHRTRARKVSLLGFVDSLMAHAALFTRTAVCEIFNNVYLRLAPIERTSKFERVLSSSNLNAAGLAAIELAAC